MVSGLDLYRKGHRAMSDPTPTYATVRVNFDPYSHKQVQDFLKKVYCEFGKDKSRWYFKSANIEELDSNVWVLDFVFINPHDATIFGLKYLR